MEWLLKAAAEGEENPTGSPLNPLLSFCNFYQVCVRPVLLPGVSGALYHLTQEKLVLHLHQIRKISRDKEKVKGKRTTGQTLDLQ